MDDNFNVTGLPLGLAFGMALDGKALQNYANLSEYQKEKLIAESKKVRSKSEMEQLVHRLENMDSSNDKMF